MYTRKDTEMKKFDPNQLNHLLAQQSTIELAAGTGY